MMMRVNEFMYIEGYRSSYHLSAVPGDDLSSFPTEE